jgi:hypothetical protein
LMQWGDRWIHAKAGPPIAFFDRRKGTPIQTLALRNAQGQLLAPGEVDIRAGPGAHKATVKRAAAAAKPVVRKAPARQRATRS